MATNTIPKLTTGRSGINLPPLKTQSTSTKTQNMAQTLGGLKLPTAKAPAQRGGCCGR